ncbi:phenylacetate--CoA ligase family protein [Winogradskyella immobilis]|uniref:Phenylacetate--CoA ligase family protein n=1 Tax=Winogradskyella immobilis TaxID=2816852 RepID=A0ABS8EJW9_9FLAO|nr:phenylacetate--CoA ligase family protein [Winogradskyella immobilis]MCC1483498.1 phenylacetate--CoA ligase family protein [Winogradskyella immobilis]MCG0015592.1 phenylacetate--CoA ligase family protein [Winogradskyella immobilis]
MQLFNLSLRIKGFKINKAKKAFSKIKAIGKSDYPPYIEDKKRAIIEYHLKYNSFYQSIGKQINLNDWNTVPVLTKRHLQQPLSERLSKGFNEHSVYVNKTSGSSGDPFVFAKDKWSHALTWAEIMHRFSWYSIDFNSSKQARFYGIPLDKKGYYKERIKDFFANRYRFSIFDLSESAFENCINKFSNTSFDYINGYTSPIVQFAKYLKEKDIVLKDICPSLKVCMVTSEMLFEDDKKLLETQFGIPIVNEYGASELDLIAFENPKGEWQLNSETLFVEILDDENNPLNYGNEGRVVITSLYNKAHPFIRYDIGDIGILSKKSTLKKPILEKLVGRTNDIVILPSGKKAAGLTFYYITKSIIEDDGNVKEFIIEQLTLDHFKVIYVSKDSLSKDKKEIITKAMETYLEKGISISFEKQQQLMRSKSGKLKQFISHI